MKHLPKILLLQTAGEINPSKPFYTDNFVLLTVLAVTNVGSVEVTVVEVQQVQMRSEFECS